MSDPPPRPRPAADRSQGKPPPTRGWQPRRVITKPLPPPAPPTTAGDEGEEDKEGQLGGPTDA